MTTYGSEGYISGHSSRKIRAGLDADISSSNDTSATIRSRAIAQGKYISGYSFQVVANAGGTTASGNGTFQDACSGSSFVTASTPGTVTATRSVTKTHSAQSFTMTATVQSYSDGTHTPIGSTGKSTVSTTITVPAKTSYVVSFDANGGSGAPGNQTKWYGESLTLPTSTPTKPLHNFLGWSTSATATTATYKAGGSYTSNAGAKLYAVWELAYVAPSANITKVFRSTEGGVDDDEGTALHIELSYSADRSIKSDNVVDRIVIQHKLNTSSTWTTDYEITGLAKASGTLSYTGKSGVLGVESTYDVRAYVEDTAHVSMGITSESLYRRTVTATIAVAFFTMDFLKGGHGVAIGKPSTRTGLDIGMKTWTSGVVESNYTGDLAFHHNNPNSAYEIAFGIGSGKINRGIWQVAPNTKWLLYYDDYGEARINTSRGTGKIHAMNKVLWSGGHFMSSSQTATLSEKVSDQTNGIVLVWSAYASDASQDYDYISCYIPKQYVVSHSSKGIDMSMCTSDFNWFAAKYLYVSDTTISGHSSNNQTGTGSCGIKYSNTHWVLREVIGV